MCIKALFPNVIAVQDLLDSTLDKEGDAAVIQLLTDVLPSITNAEVCNHLSSTILHEAVISGSWCCVKLILDKAEQVGGDSLACQLLLTQDGAGYTPLMRGCSRPACDKIVQLLVDRIKRAGGTQAGRKLLRAASYPVSNTAFHCAAHAPTIGCMTILLEMAVQPSYGDASFLLEMLNASALGMKYTPLHYAVFDNSPDMVKLIVDAYGQNRSQIAESVDALGATPLELAQSMSGSEDMSAIIKLLENA